MQAVCVIGLDYIALPTAVMFATQGQPMVGVDVKPEVVATPRDGGIPIEEPNPTAFVRTDHATDRAPWPDTPEVRTAAQGRAIDSRAGLNRGRWRPRRFAPRRSGDGWR